ncbi:hypothetical protein DR950_18180 [Kitasatospora xanthocidica]|uniref:ScoMcrA-like SRA domain-containing protein n=1 Tax=Kitasatospora xanthocidica TaxID=83382 RepID=A0A372ZVE1_9ACTN|nr:hypothetical protein [Kitasatospora xanthocidica]RGD59464.1 hypothetical protein DR950_18180 [Kitasatospora xanthocidica]
MEEVQMMNESIQPGTTLTRRRVHDLFGGRLQGGISPTKGERILVFIGLPKPGSPAPGLSPDGTLHYVGEGAKGDQQFTQSNRALLHHKEDGRRVHVFQDRGTHLIGGERLYKYIGEFEVAADNPYYYADEVNQHGQARRVINFRLRPVGGDNVPFVDPGQIARRQREARLRNSPPDEVLGTRTAPRNQATELVARFIAHLHARGHRTSRIALPVPHESDSGLVDLFDETTQTIYEVKSSAARTAVRQAIGQLLDYRWRQGGTASMGIILPSEPYPDLLALCTSLSIEVVWPAPDTGFRSSKD